MLAAAWVALSGTGAAQDWPSRPITLVVPFAAGGGVDTSARIQSLQMGEFLKQSIVIENVGAAAGTTGSNRVARAAPDGYTVLIGNTGTHAYSQTLSKKPLYNSITDFAPVGLVSESPRILLARKDLPVNNLQELIAYIKANQKTMQYGSAGVGAGTHLPCVLFNLAIGVDVTQVPYRGEGPTMQDLIAGRIDYMCATIQTGAAQAKQGTVKGIAVMAPKRVAIIPELATTGEQGLAGVEAERVLPAEGNAEPDHAQAQQGDERHARCPCGPHPAGRARSGNCRIGAAHTRIPRQTSPRGNRPLGQADPGRWYRRQLILQRIDRGAAPGHQCPIPTKEVIK